MSRSRSDPYAPSPEICQEFGKVCVKLRGGDMSQEYLAELAGCHVSSIGAIERGESCPTLDTVERIADAFEVKPSMLMKMAGY